MLSVILEPSEFPAEALIRMIKNVLHAPGILPEQIRSARTRNINEGKP